MKFEALLASARRASTLLKSMGNEHRLMILCHLAQGEMSVGGLLERLPLSQSALSQHLARMRAEGLVAARRDSRTVYYRIDDPKVARLLAALKRTFCPGPEATPTLGDEP